MGLFGSSKQENIQRLLKSAQAKCERDDRRGEISDLTQVIELDPKNASAYAYRGNAYYHLDRFDESIKDFEKALSFEPTNEIFLFGLACAKREGGDMKGAFATYTRAIKINPSNADFWHNRGQIKRYAMDAEGARKDFEMAVRLGDYASQRFVDLCSHFGNARSFEENITNTVLNVDEIIQEGLTYKSQGNWQLALGSFSRAVQLYPRVKRAVSHKRQLEQEIGI